MTITPTELLLYAAALLVLFLTPGPVWLALTARTISGGYGAAWPLALGVSLGDMFWPLIAVFGLSWVTGAYAEVMLVLRWIAVAIFIVLGVQLIRKAGRPIETDARLTRPGRWGGFAAGVTAILGNPKAILFYMGVLPGFFDLSALTPADIAAIVALSVAVPLIGNLVFAALVARARHRLAGPGGMARLNRIAGGLLVVVALLIAVT
ncbi:amino acid transporter LysE [Defluviimonas sp. 20V17]|uniref:Threonine transporter RhtB n=1 Tax=Allgaiera indica TaxID=765699 RepID=A0AAN4ZY33_9RHOB|nr:LysE family translocator [Allgaiera indica]KDB03526.1 amino acid transporter LysE [Defluviimonas sp. 20V17]GHD98466.1 threonine transporter RhtB [Allgaiera indica]SDW46958.1 Threonine/homoserine/homoserine lactone efflux protein [Allgaiera indica]